MKNIAWVASIVVVVGLAASGCVLDPTYTYCSSSSECERHERCFEITTSATRGAFCSAECTSDLGCERNLGYRGSCMDVDGYGGICFQECDFHDDCYSTSGCFDFTDRTGFVNRVCLPQRL
ncbi:MAG: hypothetical protein KF729_16250 [Sandaracinaceae bacterium]|nr:hypothetical protein [Sandaracinaceae bacterium]